MKFLKGLWFKYKYWKAPIYTRWDPATPDYDMCIHYKIVDGIVYVLSEYRNYKNVNLYQMALFTRLLPKIREILKK